MNRIDSQPLTWKSFFTQTAILLFVMVPMLVFTITTKVACEDCDLCSNRALTPDEFFIADRNLQVWFGEQYFFLAGFVLALIPVKYPWLLTLLTVVVPYALLGGLRCNNLQIALFPLSPMLMMGLAYGMVYLVKRRFFTAAETTFNGGDRVTT